MKINCGQWQSFQNKKWPKTLLLFSALDYTAAYLLVCNTCSEGSEADLKWTEPIAANAKEGLPKSEQFQDVR